MTYYLTICAVILSGLVEAVHSQRGHCAKDHCLVFLPESGSFLGAQASCKEKNAELPTVDVKLPQETLKSLLSGFSGTLWVKTPGFTGLTREEASSGLKTCPSLRTGTGEDLNITSLPCQDRADGFLCRYEFKTTCIGLNPGGGARVKYSSHWGFDLKDSDPITTGSFAVVEKVGSKYPESKHVCIEGQWMSAPWNCGVFGGGCERGCTGSNTCNCPAGQLLHPNKISCVEDPCDLCTQGCEKQGDSHMCKCDAGYKLAPDRMSCEDVDECKEQRPCQGEGRECVNTPGSFVCPCQHGFFEDAGVCVNSSICMECEHKCQKQNGVYRCVCFDGFRVSPTNATRCERDCREMDCEAECIHNVDVKKPDMEQCRCPDGYIRDMRGNKTICTDNNECVDRKLCQHKCENSFGSYRCLCDEGFTLHDDGHRCEKDPDVDVEDDSGSGFIPAPPTPANSMPAEMPSYVKTGSALGISVFVLMCVVLLFCVVRHMMDRCAKLNISSLHTDMDIFHLQQVTTETYKRLSFDKSFKNDIQRQ